MAKDRGVLTVKGALASQVIDAFQQGGPDERQLTAGVLCPGFIDHLSHGRLVLIELPKGPLEVGVSVGGAGHEASGRGKLQDVIPFA